MLFQIDDTISQRESNDIFKLLDTDDSKSVKIEEFERYFGIDPNNKLISTSVERLRWASEIFQEINVKMIQQK